MKNSPHLRCPPSDAPAARPRGGAGPPTAAVASCLMTMRCLPHCSAASSTTVGPSRCINGQPPSRIARFTPAHCPTIGESARFGLGHCPPFRSEERRVGKEWTLTLKRRQGTGDEEQPSPALPAL